MRNRFNPQRDSHWFGSIVNLITSITMLAIVLTGQRSFASASTARWSICW